VKELILKTAPFSDVKLKNMEAGYNRSSTSITTGKAPAIYRHFTGKTFIGRVNAAFEKKTPTICKAFSMNQSRLCYKYRVFHGN
jgi:hypothetical protein